MARERSPERDKAKQMWLESSGTIKLKDIAAALSVGENKVRKWKSVDRWDEELKGSVPSESNGSVPIELKGNAPHRGAPKGNKNAVGNRGGAPPGNQNAKGNRGGAGGPPGNKKAVTTGEFETIWFDTLTTDEQRLLDQIDTDTLVQAEEAIALLTIRERRMMQRIKDLMEGLTEKERSVLYELKTTKDVGVVHDEKTGLTKKVPISRDQLVKSKVEISSVRIMDDILKREEALTRVQAQKLRAIETKNRIIDEEKAARTAILQIELQKLQGAEGATASWTDAIREIAERRRAMREQVNPHE
ncbi:phage terminase small subunit [Paenibacillus apii]|uniref:phage terminase small subunit n=1 Tax=Paenibacillus apii TaxID=1850370 RepID=UPI00143B2BDB|nr:phage terminase small subunit [Paenibacillus apii]NJJ37836.1 terminase [Paenibacillus apii]